MGCFVQQEEQDQERFLKLQNFKMFEQSLDNEYFNNPYAMNQHEARFYDDYHHQTFIKPLQAQHHHQQAQPLQLHGGLPTPPSTPDKIPMNYGNFPHPAFLSQIPQHNQHGNPFSPNGELQVVPNFFGDETDETSMQRDGSHYPAQHIEDQRYNSTCLQLPSSHHTNHAEMQEAGKRVYPGLNHSPHHHQDSMEYLLNNPNVRTSEQNYYRQLAYEKFCNENKTSDTYESCEPELSRATHNVLERQRRNDLKVRFNLLRDQIPDLAHNDKAPKIQILKKGHDYLRYLKKEEQMLLVDKELEKQKKLILLERLRLLKQNL